MKTLLLLPTFNEAGTVAEAIERTLASTADVDVVVIDDSSPDGTGEIADRIAATHDRVRVLHRPSKGGLGPAYVAGFRRALEEGYDAVLEMDADLSHDPADIPRLIAGAQSADLVIGSRYVPGGGTRNWSRGRIALSKAGNAYARWLLRIPLADATGGFRCYRRAVLESVALDDVHSQGYAFQIEMAWRAWTLGFALAEIPITFVERRDGASKMSRRIVAEALLAVPRWALRRRRPPDTVHPRSVRVSTAD